MRVRAPFAVGLAGLLGLAAAAQDPKNDVPKDAVPATFRMFLVADGRFPPVKQADGSERPDPRNRTGKIHCLVCEYGLAPVVAVFVRTEPKKPAADSGVGKLAARLQGLIPRYRGDKLAGFVSFLLLDGGTKSVTVKLKKDGQEIEEPTPQDLEYPDDEKRDVVAKDTRDFAKALMTPEVPFGIAPKTSKSLTAWGIPDDAEVTVVVYYKMRLIGKPWTFAKADDLTDAKIDEILDATEEKITGKKKVKKE